jgi:hypothetical protein
LLLKGPQDLLDLYADILSPFGDIQIADPSQEVPQLHEVTATLAQDLHSLGRQL